MRTFHPTSDRHPPLMRFLSLGAGKQSTALLMLLFDGQVEAVDGAIFADTGWEPRSVYDHLDKLRGLCDEHGLPLHEVSAGNIRDDALDPDHRFASMPTFVRNVDGSKGMGRRQCTSEYKIKPINDCIRELVSERLDIEAPTWRQVPNDVRVEVVKGISVDEVRRARTPHNRWEVNHYPLLEMGWTRSRCVAYLESIGVDAPRSACIGCPFHDDDEWRDLRDNAPEDWTDAVEFDRAIRTAKQQRDPTFRGEEFLHSSLLPLADVDLRTEEDHGQGSMWDAECEGMCGL